MWKLRFFYGNLILMNVLDIRYIYSWQVNVQSGFFLVIVVTLYEIVSYIIIVGEHIIGCINNIKKVLNLQVYFWIMWFRWIDENCGKNSFDERIIKNLSIVRICAATEIYLNWISSGQSGQISWRLVGHFTVQEGLTTFLR